MVCQDGSVVMVFLGSIPVVIVLADNDPAGRIRRNAVFCAALLDSCSVWFVFCMYVTNASESEAAKGSVEIKDSNGIMAKSFLLATSN